MWRLKKDVSGFGTGSAAQKKGGNWDRNLRHISLCFRLCDSKGWQCLPASACHCDLRMWAVVHQSSTYSAHQQELWNKGQTQNSSSEIKHNILLCFYISNHWEAEICFSPLCTHLLSPSSSSFFSAFSSLTFPPCCTLWWLVTCSNILYGLITGTERSPLGFSLYSPRVGLGDTFRKLTVPHFT